MGKGGLYREKLDGQVDDNLFFRKSRTKKENKQDDMDVVDELDDMDEKG